jgi:anthranilate synthase component 1
MQLRKFPDKEQFLRLAQSANVVPVCAEILADTQTPVSLLRAFYQEQGPIFLFESVEGGERWGRYSFLGTAARTHIRVFRDEVVILEDGESRRIAHHGDPLAVLKDLMAGYRPAEMSELPRFWGGMVGYLTYEMVSFFENIPNHFPAEKPLAHFIVPSELLVFDNIRHTLLVIAPAFTDDARDDANGL